MIIGILIVSLLAFALTNVFAKKTWQTFLSLIFGLIFVASLSLIVANLSNHFGVEKVTETKTEEIVSSADPQGADMLLYKALGNGREKVYLYRTNEKQGEPKATGTNNETNKVEKTDDDAEKVTKTTYWEYKNDMHKFWFNIADNNHECDSRVSTSEIPETWVELSTDRAAKLTELVKEQQSTVGSEAKAYVQDGMVKAMTENPKVNKAEQERRTKALAIEFQQQAFAKLVEEAKGG